MKKTMTVLGFILMAALLAPATQAAPRLTIDNPVFEFGYVPQHSKVSHDFWLHSTGDDTLKVIKVVPG